MQEQETSWQPGNDLVLPSRQGWTHILPYHREIIIQVTAHSGRGGVFNPQGAALGWKAQLCNPAEPPQLTTVLHLFQHSLVSAGLTELYLQARGKDKGERTFVVTKTRFKPKGSKRKGNSHCKVCHSLLPSHPGALTQTFLSTSD